MKKGFTRVRRLVLRGARSFGVRNRRRKLRAILDLTSRTGAKNVLLVGVSGAGYKGEDLIEKGVDSAVAFTVACGLKHQRPCGLHIYVVCDARALPFRENAFDLIVSNAVIEHVGDLADQQRFVGEHCRAGQSWAMSTPNRWFPVEPHTGVLIRHWSKDWRQQQTSFTRSLNMRELRSMLPPDARVRGTFLSPTLLAIRVSPPKGSLPSDGS